MGTGVLYAMGVQTQGMVGNHETFCLGHCLLPQFDLRVIKFLNSTTVQTHHVVMVLSLVEFVNRLATFEVVSAQNTGLLKLGQHAVHGGQANVGVLPQ